MRRKHKHEKGTGKHRADPLAKCPHGILMSQPCGKCERKFPNKGKK